MKRWILALAFFGLAWAATPPVVTLYDAVVPRVLEAKRILAKDPAQALVLVEEAEKAFARSKDQLPEVIAAGIQQAIKDARVSVARKSKADLEGRIWVLRGAFGKALYDAFFEAVDKGDLDAAQVLLDRLAQATARPDTLKARAWALAQEKDIQGLRHLFEGAYLEAIAKTLDLAKEGNDRVRAYALTSKAYGLFLVIQDSPRVGDLSVKDFVAALEKLTSGDLAGFKADVSQLETAARAALDGLKQSPSPGAAPPTGQRPAAPAAPKVKAQPALPKAPAVKKTPAVQAQAAPRVATPKPKPKPKYDPELVAHFTDDLTLILGNKKKARKVALELISAGVKSIDEWRNQLYIAEGYVATAQAYLSTGQFEKARTYLGFALGRYRFSLYPLVEAVDPELARDTEGFFVKLSSGLGLRASDVGVLAVALERVRDRVFDEPVSPWFATQIGVEKATFGLPRAVMFLIAAVLALFPLYLIRLTFGGRNVYWRLLGLAVFFLLLPAILEGVSYLGDILAVYGGLPQLSVLSNLSLFQSIVVQIAWGVLIFLVIIFASWGLWGIARQFGLIRDRGENLPSPTTTTESVIEWDEEF